MNTFLSAEELLNLGLKSFGANVRISRNAIFHDPQNVTIGSHVRIDDNCFISASGGISIGSHIHIAPFCLLSGGGGIVMEDFTGISARVTLQTASDDFSGEFLTGPTVPSALCGISTGTITLRKHVVIGMHSVILPGVTIGEGAAVGACSLVRHSVDPWWIVAGIPARKLRARSKKLLDLEKQLPRDE